MRLVKVTIVYKSGAKVTFRCKEFTVKTNTVTGRIMSLEWDTPRPRPLEIGCLDEIVAVWSRRVWQR